MKIIIPKGFLVGEAGADCRGGAPGTRETDLLRPEKMMDKVNAVFLAGGSAYGLAAADGIMRWMRERGYGYRTAGKIVPIVSGAVIFDLNHREYHTPTAETGFEACENASRTPLFGQNGVGRGATAGKIRGLRYASKTGVGACTVKTAGKANDGSFIDTEKHIVSGGLLKLFAGANTTVGCILTDARIDKVQANKLASAGHGGLSRAIRPVHTDFDGDTLFCLASGKKPVLNLLLLQTAAAYAVERAVVAAATEGAAYEVSYDESAEDGEE